MSRVGRAADSHASAPDRRAGAVRRVCIVGSGTRFLSGVSYYTHRLAEALADAHHVSVILMRQLLPSRFYPGSERVGTPLTRLTYASHIPVHDGVDWYWGRSVIGSLWSIMRERPQILLLEWWTGTVLHTYLLLALASRFVGAKVVIEFHELLDTGELQLAPARIYVKLTAPLLLRMASGFVVHSEYDKSELDRHYGFGSRPVAIVPHGPYNHHTRIASPAREAPAEACNILFFGTIRPYKGLEDLIAAFGDIPEDQVHRYWLTVVGETWEGWTLPADLLAESPHRDRITFVNRYVTDEEVDSFFSSAEIVALPYLRSSASGPLHIAMSYGRPTILTQVGGLTEAAAAYEGVVWVPARDPVALRAAIESACHLRGQTFRDPQSWEHSVERVSELFDELLGSDVDARATSAHE